ncbi:hypothetical protein KVT40_001730 [Elsinoe batatas]|uniref:VPS28-domain-containing protein n=1 Tax=Elsinoe batatas TaxID=2601811 RepID=A0A8K0L986_9PEZI|nr:hypothetical protein KVT40_001730 [Elsinoe batatas]
MYSQHPQQLAYAPTPYSYTPSNLSVTINPDEEVKLATNAAERDLYESLAEIYSIIVTLEALEKAYLKDSVAENEYTETCSRLLKQYKSNLSDDNVSRAFRDLDSFKEEWDLDAPRATERLKIGLPATVEATSGRSANQFLGGGGGNAAATHIVAASENFITLLDAIQMNMLSKDTLHPILVEAIQAVNRVTDHDFENKGKIVQWLITLNQMRAAEELSSEQARELKLDMEQAYNGFKSWHSDIVTFHHMEQRFTREDLGFNALEEEPLHVHDLPQIHTRPTAKSLLDTLSLLSIQSRSWDVTPPRTPGRGTPKATSGTTTPARVPKRKVQAEGVPQYLTKIVSSRLAWIHDDAEKEKIWDTAAVRLSERSGRTAMGSFTRTFLVPLSAQLLQSLEGEFGVQEETAAEEVPHVEISIHEPALTADNLGFKTWAASYVLARNWASLATKIPAVQSCRHGHTAQTELMLELGGGTGLVGIAAAAVLGVRILLTDLPLIASNLARNVRDNSEIVEAAGATADVAVLDWSQPGILLQVQDGGDTHEQFIHAAAKPTTSLEALVIVAADPIYSMDHPVLLASAIKYHLKRTPDARVIIGLPIREAFVEERTLFSEQMKLIGLELLLEEKEKGLDDWGSDDAPNEVECSTTVWKWAT